MIDNITLERPLDIERALLGRKTLSEIPLSLMRQQSVQNLAMTLEAKPKSVDDSDPYWQALGLKLANIPSQQFKQIHRAIAAG